MASIILALATSLLMVFASIKQVGSIVEQRSLSNDQGALYLPKEEVVRALAFGYNNVLSDLMWFDTINYFGQHYRGDRSYRWLGHRCDLVTSLNPKAPGIYEFCSSMLAWESDEPEKSIELLTRAMEHNPTKWIYPYLRGVYYMHFMGDDIAARDDFITAATFPDSHVVVKRVAAKKLALTDSTENAIEFLNFLLHRSTNPIEREALARRIDDVRYEEDLRLWRLVVEEAKAANIQFESLNELLELAPKHLSINDPYGGQYVLDKESNEIGSSTGKRALSRQHMKRHSSYSRREGANSQ